MSKYQIKINKPCSEDWYSMTDLERGKFCDSCKKNVHDFTQYSNLELARKIKKGDNLCGRFKEEQLDTDLIIPQNFYIPKFGYMLSILGILGLSSPILSQTKIKEKTTINWNQSDTGSSNSKIKKRIIKGNISDHSGSLPGVSIVIKGTRIGVETDFKGNFKLIIDKKYLRKNNITLHISYLGYKTETVTVTKKNFRKKVNAILKEDDVIMGEIILTYKNKPLEKKKDCKNNTHKQKS